MTDEIIWTGNTVDLRRESLVSLMREVSENANRAFNRAVDVAGPDCRDSLLGLNWVAFTADGREFVVRTPVTNDRDRTAIPDQMRALFRQHNVVRYAVIYEAWISYGDGRPSLDPERVEAVFIHVEGDSHKPMTGARRITRLVGCRPYLDRLVVAKGMPDDLYGGLLSNGADHRLN